MRWVAFAYGLASYVVFLGAFLYAISFVGNLVILKSIDERSWTSRGRGLYSKIPCCCYCLLFRTA